MSDPHDEFKGKNVLIERKKSKDPSEITSKYSMSIETYKDILGECRRKLFEVRSRRARPHLDDKVIVSWNGLAISSFSRAYKILLGEAEGTKFYFPVVGTEKSINELLPLELLQAILVRVPAKHLFPLRFVSKLWLSLISDPTFVEFHFHHTSEFTIPSYFFAHNDQLVGSVDLHALFHGGATLDTSIEKFSLPFPWKKNTRSNLLVLGSCRGFVLLRHYPYYIILWNPVTQSHKKISYYNAVKKNNIIHGIGYDASNDDYVIVIFSKENQPHCFSLRTNSWTKIDVAPPTPLITYEFIPWGLFFNGAIHWLSYRPSNRDILIFDVKKRRFSKIPLPEQKLTWWPSKLVILGGCLALNFFDYRDNNKRTQVWVLKKYKVPSSWILLYEIPHHCISLFLSNYSDVIVLDRVTMNFAKYKLEGERVQCFKYFNYSFCHVIAFEHISTVYTPSLATLPSCDKKKWKNEDIKFVKDDWNPT
ncbi:hypothetical protein Ahy_Scaffold8g108491 isoform D [Arachis hypogaea]|uniref:F-box domain-containing protein n=1 Tax=Arachis hypogaea TaxID=3818 RepID=A0A444WNW8_ARAHY|nr:hypothetical protein Ahy_Scaffold8g108491 isoform D [Arachis hypogaea]